MTDSSNVSFTALQYAQVVERYNKIRYEKDTAEYRLSLVIDALHRVEIETRASTTITNVAIAKVRAALLALEEK